MSNKEVLRFWKLALCDVEARVRRLRWAQMLVQDPPHHAQLITAMFGKLPSEPNPTLGPGDEILQEANPWAVRWKADLEKLEPYDERGVIQRMGRDVRDLVLDRELAEDFVSMDVTMLRLRSLAVEVPPWDFREEAGHPMELSEEGVPQCRRCFDEQCEARTESFKALATHVLRHHRQNGGGVSIGDHKSVSSLPCGLWGQKRLIVISCRQVHIPLSLRCSICSAEPRKWSELQQHIAEHLRDVFKNDGLRDAFLGQAQAGGGQGRRAVRQAVAEGKKRPRRHSAPGGRAGDSVSGQRGRTERADRHRVQDVPGSVLGERGRSNGRGGSTLPRIRWRKQEQARSRARRRPRATRSPVRACPAQSGGDEGAGTRTRGGVEVVPGEQRGEERTSAAGGARTALSSEAVQENRGQGRLDAHRVLAWTLSLYPLRERWKQHCSCRKG